MGATASVVVAEVVAAAVVALAVSLAVSPKADIAMHRHRASAQKVINLDLS
jgi:hypothetical protein